MKKINKAIGISFLIGGMAIIVAIFLLFLKETMESNMLILNMAASCLAYAITFISAFDLLGPVKEVSKAAPGYGLRWVASGLYLPAVIITVILSVVPGMGFNLCLILQIAYLFCFLLLTALSVALSHNVNASEAKEQARRSGLTEIQINLALLEAQCAVNAVQLSPKVAGIKEEVRYITASESPAAKALEEKLIRQIALATTKLESPAADLAAVEKELDACLTLIELRKKQY